MARLGPPGTSAFPPLVGAKRTSGDAGGDRRKDWAGKGAGGSGGRGKKKHSGQLAHSVGRAADKAAKATGKKRRTLDNTESITAAAEQDPGLFGDLAERLKEDDVKVDALHREMKRPDYAARIFSVAHKKAMADRKPRQTRASARPMFPAPSPRPARSRRLWSARPKRN